MELNLRQLYVKSGKEFFVLENTDLYAVVTFEQLMCDIKKFNTYGILFKPDVSYSADGYINVGSADSTINIRPYTFAHELAHALERVDTKPHKLKQADYGLTVPTEVEYGQFISIPKTVQSVLTEIRTTAIEFVILKWLGYSEDLLRPYIANALNFLVNEFNISGSEHIPISKHIVRSPIMKRLRKEAERLKAQEQKLHDKKYAEQFGAEYYKRFNANQSQRMKLVSRQNELNKFERFCWCYNLFIEATVIYTDTKVDSLMQKLSDLLFELRKD